MRKLILNSFSKKVIKKFGFLKRNSNKNGKKIIKKRIKKKRFKISI